MPTATRPNSGQPLAISGIFAPGYKPLDPDRYSPRTFHPVGLRVIDHIVANVEEGKMGDWVDYYHKVMGFSLLASFDDKDISTDYSALMSKVVADGRGRIKFPINEPAKGRRRSQIEEFLDYYNGPGVQHIALATADIVASVRAMAANDVSFLRCRRRTTICSPIASARSGKTLASSPSWASWSIATMRAICSRSSPNPSRTGRLCFSRSFSAGARSFGKGNFKALFEAIELEQARRGTL